ncbi:MAG TPA: Holliday junction branch migration protein RuvA [Candidatus Pygmaiobacter gallistercoris]|nr:Holliday junction branch migration protein RuvA [Candidatus Pygmaiobacter gallistercoris]
MIYSLNGKILEKGTDRVVIECAGVGYEVRVPLSAASALPAQGAQATLYTFLNVSENDISLFGFLTAADRQMFRLLTGVSGVGPKVGLAILSALSCDRVALAISAGDAKAFTAASGVGPKLGQRIVLELKDKVGKGLVGEVTAGDLAPAAPVGGAAQAVAALCALGYNQSEAAQAITRLDPSLPVEELVRLALRSMAGKVR